MASSEVAKAPGHNSPPNASPCTASAPTPSLSPQDSPGGGSIIPESKPGGSHGCGSQGAIGESDPTTGVGADKADSGDQEAYSESWLPDHPMGLTPPFGDTKTVPSL